MPLDSIDPKVLDAFDKLNRALESKDYNKILSNLRRMGRPIKQAWHAKLLQEKDEITQKNKFTSNDKFKAFLADKIYELNIPEEHIQSVPEPINYLKNQLAELAIFLMIWKEKPSEKIQSKTPENVNFTQEPGIEQTALSTHEYQKNKFKGPVDKDDRHAINIALQAMAFILCRQANEFIQREEILNNYPKDFALKNSTNAFIASESKEQLISFIFIHLYRMDKFKSYRYEKTIDPGFSLDNNENTQKQKIEKIGLAISSFLTPNKKKKFLKYAGILLAFIASLACGLTTGGAIYLLGPGLLAFAISLGILTLLVGLTFNRSFTGIAIALVCGLAMGGAIFSLGLLLAPGLGLLVSAICLGGLTGFFGFTANFGFFSKNFPDFLLSLVKKGGISEYIDIHDKRKQFSATYKYLLTPLIIFASLTVGAGTTALTYITISSLFVKLALLLPVLAIIWPPLPVIIAVVLAAAVGTALTVAVMTASLEALKKVAALNLGFIALCQYTYKNCLEWFKNLKNLKTHEIVGLVILLLLLPVGFFGLGYFRYFAGVDLSVFIGITGAIVTGVVAYIAQMAFIGLSINKLKNAIIRPSASANDFPALTVNAAGNGILVYDGSPVSLFGMIACIINSFSGNMSETDMKRQQRRQATDALASKITLLFNNHAESGEASAATSHSDSGQTLKPLAPSVNNNSYPQEPKSPTPSTHSEDGSMLENISRPAANYSNSYGSSSSHHFKSVLLTTPAEGAKAAELKPSARFK
ncbi:hypothetical protein [Rickettsiella endosymbiont of Aleochara curtula]|uniref:hypothetical protein n=1 Tax=Rickettsiella endosymbiont of Aleochara curtula TaxID=3077936 RepID=UPI00313C1A4F